MWRSSKARSRSGQRFAPSHYRLTGVVHDLRKGGSRRLSRRRSRQIVNNSAATKMWRVDQSASLLSFQPENTHRPATNMHRKQSCDYSNQSFGRARCAPVRQTNSHLPTRFQRLDYKAFAEREQCVFAQKERRSTPKKEEDSQMNQNAETQSPYAAFVGLDSLVRRFHLCSGEKHVDSDRALPTGVCLLSISRPPDERS
jgi:hypothetical protein